MADPTIWIRFLNKFQSYDELYDYARNRNILNLPPVQQRLGELQQSRQQSADNTESSEIELLDSPAGNDVRDETLQDVHQQKTASPVVKQSSLENTTNTFTFTPTRQLDLLSSLSEVEPNIFTEIVQELNRHDGVRWFVTVIANYWRMTVEEERIEIDQVFRSEMQTTMNQEELSLQIAAVMQELYKQSVTFEANGSGWSLETIRSIKLFTVAYRPLKGSKYVELPPWILAKKAVLNLRNTDDKCVMWSILAGLHPVDRRKKPHELRHYRKHKDELKMQDVSFPTPISDIAKIERQNNISINVFGFHQKNDIYPLHRTADMKERHVNLLLITDGDKRHYCHIRNFSRLMGHTRRDKHKKFFCYNCLHGFTREWLLQRHVELCFKQKTQKITFPEEQTIKFKNIQKQLPAPFVFYADFECFTTKIQTCENNPEKTNSTRYQKHEPSGYAYMVVSSYEKYTKPPVVYRGVNAVDHFFASLHKEEQYIVSILKHVQPMDISIVEETNFQMATDCHICNKPLHANRVRDHDHLTGKYRGAAHRECNILYRYTKVNQTIRASFVIPVIMHNLRGYDSHLLMESIGKYKKRRMRCIPNNMERYVSFSLGRLRFIDSFQFMSASLERLINNLADEGKGNFQLLQKNVPDERQQELLLRKGVYPYDHMDNPARFHETSLPTKAEFYNQLNEETLSEEDYAHAQSVWNVFNCKTMGDYHDLYLKSDVLLLADVFENFRKMSQQTYKLDPAHYYTAPGLSWDSMLKMTGVELELISDLDMYLMVESGIRGGVSMITKKYAEANNPYTPGFDPTRPTNYLLYLDANNLYGWAMSQKMPVNNFCWMTQQEVEEFDVRHIPDDGDTGYILEVDLEYPKSLHDIHSDLPVAAESKTMHLDQLSSYTQNLAVKLQIKGRPSRKLIPNLNNKCKYVVHYMNLKQYLYLGLKLCRIHRGIRFHQTHWLQQYIAMNTQLRKTARNCFEKDFYKLMNNSVFGKTMENVRGRVDIELVHQAKRMLKIAAKPNFHRFHIFNENLTAAQCLKTTIELCKPIYVGFTILDVSKSLMYDFHYHHIKSRYGAKAELCFTDTDSLLYDIQTDDIYDDMMDCKELFDTSDYPTAHKLYSAVNKKVIGLMKDETAGKPIKEFVGLRSKMYSILCGGVEKKTAKGIKKTCIKNKLRHVLYKDVLLNETVTRATMRLIRSQDHQLYSMIVNKLALSPYDDKRYVLNDKLSTRAIGHYKNQIE